MKRLAIAYSPGLVVVALVLAGSGCTRERAAPGRPTSAPPAAAPPSTPSAPADASHDTLTVTARCTYHPNEGIDSLARTLPAGSVDVLELNDPMTGLMLVVVDVTVTPKPRSAPSKFTTTFRLPSGVEAQKPWQGAAGNVSGAFRAVFTVPLDAQCVATAARS